MLPIPSFLAPASVCARVLNALLARERWAGERLSRHAGKTMRFVLGSLVLGFTVNADGSVQACDPAIVPDTTLTIPAERLAELPGALRSEEHTSELQSLMRISYAVFCLKKKTQHGRQGETNKTQHYAEIHSEKEQ